MAVNKRLERAYGFGQGIYDLSPKPIVAQRAPTARDMAEIGTIWVDQVAGIAYTLISVIANVATWGNQAQIGALVNNLTINPGPFTTTGVGAVNISADAVNTTVNVGTGAGIKVVTVGSGTLGSSTDILAGTGGMLLQSEEAAANAIEIVANNAAGGVTTTSGTGGEIHTSTGPFSFATTAALANAIEFTASNAAGGIVLSAANATVNTTYLPVTGEAHTLTNLPFSVATGTGLVTISGDATNNTVNLGTGSGASVKTVNLGSTIGASATAIRSGTAGISLATGAIAGDAGSISMAPLTSSVASPTAAATMNRRVGRATFTGFTTVAAASQVFTITNSTIIANSGIFVTAQNNGANDAQMTVARVKPAVGSMEVTLRNDGAAALNGDVIITFWVIS